MPRRPKTVRPTSASNSSGVKPKPGDSWKPLKIAAGAAVVAPAVAITAIMLDKSVKGAENDGKEFTIIRLYNKDSTSNILVCQFKPSCDPNGIVSDDTLEFKNTGTFLDGNIYAVEEKTGLRTTVEFEADQRLSNEIRQGSFVLGTSFENQMDNQANNMNPGNWLINGAKDMFNNLFGAMSGPAMIGSGICSVLICLVIIFLIVRQFS